MPCNEQYAITAILPKESSWGLGVLTLVLQSIEELLDRSTALMFTAMQASAFRPFSHLPTWKTASDCLLMVAAQNVAGTLEQCQPRDSAHPPPLTTTAA